MSKDRYIYHGGKFVNDLNTGEEIEIFDAVERLNACERVFNRVIVVVEQREEE